MIELTIYFLIGLITYLVYRYKYEKDKDVIWMALLIIFWPIFWLAFLITYLEKDL